MRRSRPILQWLAERRQARVSELPPGVACAPDLPYGDDPAQRLDVYRPAGRATGPVLVVVHGGGWRRGDKAAEPVIAHKLAHWGGRGWVMVSVAYRLWPAARLHEQAADVARAVAFVQRHAASWGADPAQIALLGHSAGGHLAALAAVDPALAAAAGAEPWPATVVIDTAALDVAALMAGPHLPMHAEVFGSDPQAWGRDSPLQRLQSAPASAMLLVCSSRRDDSIAAAQAFAARANHLGGRAQVLPVAIGHLRLNSELGRDPDYTAAVDDFLRGAGVGSGETPAGIPNPGL